MNIKTLSTIFVLMLLLTLNSCGLSNVEVQDNSDQDRLRTQIAATLYAEMQATNTARPSAAFTSPTDMPGDIKGASDKELWSKNYAGSAESGGVKIEIARVVVGYKEAFPAEYNWHNWDNYIEGWENTKAIGEIIFKITNNTNFTVNIYPNFGSVQIGNEQIELENYSAYTPFGDDTQGEIYSGVTKIGGIWFGIKRPTPEAINQIIYRCDAPYGPDSYDPLGQDIEIIMDFQNHAFEEMPEELK